MPAYQRDLAYIHHTGFTRFATKAAPGLLRALRRHRITGGLVVDAGCGSGVWARELSSRGYQVLGIDISPSMIQLARRQAPHARFIVGSFLSAALPPCHAITCLGECVNYTFDRASGIRALRKFFDAAYHALHPGGLFIFDVVEPGLVTPPGPERRFLEGADWAIFLEVREDYRRRLLSRHIVSFRRVGKLYRRSEEIHRLHLYARSQLLDELSAAGFEVQVLNGYGHFRFAPAHAAFLARKPR